MRFSYFTSIAALTSLVASSVVLPARAALSGNFSVESDSTASETLIADYVRGSDNVGETEDRDVIYIDRNDGRFQVRDDDDDNRDIDREGDDFYIRDEDGDVRRVDQSDGDWDYNNNDDDEDDDDDNGGFFDIFDGLF